MATKCEQTRKKRDRLRRQHEEYLRQSAVRESFNASLQRVIDAFGLSDLYKKLPLKVQNRILFSRMRSVRLELTEGCKVSRRRLKEIRFYLATLLKHFDTPLLPENRRVSLEDFCTAGITLYFYGHSKRGYCEAELKFKKELFPLVENLLKNKSPSLYCLDDMLTAIGTIFSRLNQSMYHFIMDLYSEGAGLSLKMSFSVKLHQTKAVTRSFVIAGKSRPAYRVGGPVARIGFLWAQIPSVKLGVDSSFGALPLDVYIQSHALIRIRERMDTIYHGEMEIILNFSLRLFEKAVKYKKQLLIPSIFHDIKIGYYLVEIIEGIALIKTFLFITNSGTPEGDDLDKELNAGKIEKEYLKLDILSTYVNSDLTCDTRIRAIFEKVGLGYMCTLDRETYSKSKIVKDGYAEDFIKYLLRGRDEWQYQEQ